jgi:RNA polymerase sigma factor (sigma-70 family)
MNVHFTYKQTKTSDLEVLINQQVEKLRKRLQVFRPDLVSLHGAVENGSRAGTSVSLNLRLPSGQIAARSVAESAGGAVRASFEDLLAQLAKHKAQLRAQHHWPRQRRLVKNPVSQVPFETTVAAVRPELVTQNDITAYIDADLSRLRRFVDRELRHRVSSGVLRQEQLTAEEVIDEAIASALSDDVERPEKLALEPWLCQMARLAIERLARGSAEGWVSLESGQQESSEESEPEEGAEAVVHLHRQEYIPDKNLISEAAETPEEQAATDEFVAMVDLALRDARPEEREAFILYVFEGFTGDEIAAIMDMEKFEVHQAIRRARERVRQSIPVEDKLKTTILARAELA